jgi:hypothetical protein
MRCSMACRSARCARASATSRSRSGTGAADSSSVARGNFCQLLMRLTTAVTSDAESGPPCVSDHADMVVPWRPSSIATLMKSSLAAARKCGCARRVA